MIGLGALAYRIDSGRDTNKIALTYLSALNSLVGVVISHVCDPDREAMEQFELVYKVAVRKYHNFREIIAESNEYDLLCIATPNDTHFEILSSAIRANVKNILCEKPIVTNADDLLTISNLIDHSTSRVIVNHCLRWDPEVQRMRTECRDSKAVQLIRATYVKGFIHNGIHILDLIVWYYGLPKQILKLREAIVNGHNCIDVVMFYDGFVAHLNFLDDRHYTEAELDIIIGGHRLVLGSGTYWISRYLSSLSEDIIGYSFLGPSPTLCQTGQLKSMYHVLKEVLIFITDINKTDHSFSSFKESAQTMRLAFAIEASNIMELTSVEFRSNDE